MTRLFALCLLLAVSHAVPAASLQTLLEQDHLRLQTWLEPADSVVVGQEVRLVVEVATRRWFAGGTQIRHPEVANLVILQRDNFATNLSRQESGQTWVVQQWRLELYPQAAGMFRIPSLQLELAVNDASAGIVRGQLMSEALQFSAAVPGLMSTTSHWLAAPQFSVEQNFDRELAGLQPGDALTRTITLEAIELNSMMLPAFEEAPQPGLASYPSNPRLQDRSNRGAAAARRIEEISYVIEKAGQYQLPEKNYYWWNTATQSAEIATLAAITIDAGVAPSTKAETRVTPTLSAFPFQWLLLAPLAGLLIAWYRIYRRRVANDLLGAAQRALRQGHESRGLSLAYTWLNREQPGPDWLSLRHTIESLDDGNSGQAIESLMRSVYAKAPIGKNTRNEKPATLKLTAAHSQRSASGWRRLWQPIDLSINPGDNAGE